MRTCPNCKTEVHEDDLYCPNCGKAVKKVKIENMRESTFFHSFISFIFPPLGFFVYILNKGSHPFRAKKALRSTILGLLLYLLIGALILLFWLLIIIGILT